MQHRPPMLPKQAWVNPTGKQQARNKGLGG